MPLDFNMSEIVLLVVLAVIIFGPEKLPELARKAGRVVNYVRNIANDAKGQLRQELGPEFDNLNLSDLNPRALIDKHVLNPVESTLDPIKAELAPVKTSLGAAAAAGAAAVAATPAAAGTQAPGPAVEAAPESGAIAAAASALVVATPVATVPFDPEAT